MSRNLLVWLVLAASLPACGAVKGAERKKFASRAAGPGMLWQEPRDIRSRDLFYGPGGKNHEPHGPFTFVKEDLQGTNPKFVVRDEDGVKWKVKLGEEARPETVASRLVWAVGYFTDEDYFLPNIKVEKMGRLKRGRRLIGADGSVSNVRLKREDYKTEGEWSWKEDPFSTTREWNGLRVLMALINNWDLKDENNKIRDIDGRRVYLVSDLGASFGSTGYLRNRAKAKGNVRSYSHSKFIQSVDSEYVNFVVPSRPTWLDLAAPRDYIRRIHLEWIGRQVPVADARWMGRILASLSVDQIHDAFRAAGYSPDEVQRFSTVVESRITQLNRL